MKNARLKINTSLIVVILLVMSFIGCANKKSKQENLEVNSETISEQEPFFKLSLAQWSLHNFVQIEKGDPFQFASMAKEMGFEGLEYVSQLYDDEIELLGMDKVIDSLKTMSQLSNIQNVLIMVDHEGDLADPDETKRNEAVENHKKWVDAAEKLGCHSIRVNTFGTNNPEVWKVTVVDGLKKLSEYAATKNINILCENHGWLSSDAPKLMEAIKADIQFKGATAWILICSIIVASIGLNTNSIPVVIGAMLISPLMGPILGIGLSIAINDIDTLKTSLVSLGTMILLSILTSFFYFWIFLNFFICI